MSRVRVALVGCGLVGQAEHAFYLSTNCDLFDFVALVDASATVREGVGDRYRIPVRVASVGELDAGSLDAIVCATPDVFHSDVVLWALEHGLHVLCEKPLAFTLRECDEMIAARDKAGKVAQVGYMKRHDPAYLRMLELLPTDAGAVKCISIEVNDPNSRRSRPTCRCQSAPTSPPNLRADGRRRAVEMVAEATGLSDVPEAASIAFQNAFLSSLVHDISMLHGILEHLGHTVPARLVDASIFAGGDGGAAGWQLDGGGGPTAFHLTLEGVNDYTERLTVYCTDRILELTFPAPYLRNMPTRLIERRSAGDIGLTETRHHVSYAEAFENELRSFHRSITTGAPGRGSAGGRSSRRAGTPRSPRLCHREAGDDGVVTAATTRRRSAPRSSAPVASRAPMVGGSATSAAPSSASAGAACPVRTRSPPTSVASEVYTDLDEMLDRQRPDVLHICSPHGIHADQAAPRSSAASTSSARSRWRSRPTTLDR